MHRHRQLYHAQTRPQMPGMPRYFVNDELPQFGSHHRQVLFGDLFQIIGIVDAWKIFILQIHLIIFLIFDGTQIELLNYLSTVLFVCNNLQKYIIFLFFHYLFFIISNLKFKNCEKGSELNTETRRHGLIPKLFNILHGATQRFTELHREIRFVL
jgi:hypothetical protein